MKLMLPSENLQMRILDQLGELEDHRKYFDRTLRDYRDTEMYLMGRGMVNGKLIDRVRDTIVRAKTALGDIHRCKKECSGEGRNNQVPDWFDRARQNNLRNVEA